MLGLIKFPFVLVDQEREYILKTYNEQYKKVGGAEKGIDVVGLTKALIGTGLVATSETLSTVATWLAEKKKVAENEINKAKSESQ